MNKVYFYGVLFQKSFLRQLQYRMSHMLNNLGSLIFGFIYVAIWQGTLGSSGEVTGYSSVDMARYITFTQAMLFITTFLVRGLSIQDGMRTGAVSLELMRPVSFMGLHGLQSLGFQVYNLLFRSLPIFLAMSWALEGFYFPSLTHWPHVFTMILLAIWNGFLLQYLVGLSSFWTTDNRWAFVLNLTLIMTFSGNFVPIPLLPAPFDTIGLYLPFATLQYYPVLGYLGDGATLHMGLSVGWGLALTALAAYMTRKARQRMEIQGG